MAKRIPIRKKKKVNKLAKYLGVRLSDLHKVKQGKELRGVDMAYHVSPMHPEVITKIHVGVIHQSMKYQVIKWVKQGNLYILKD